MGIEPDTLLDIMLLLGWGLVAALAWVGELYMVQAVYRASVCACEVLSRYCKALRCRSCGLAFAVHGNAFRSARLVGFVVLGCQFSNVALAGTLHIYDRAYGRKLFEKFAPSFEKATGYDLEFHVLEFPVYEDAEESLIYGDSIDMVAMYPTLISRFVEAGWITSLEREHDFDLAVEHMYASAKAPLQHRGEIFAGSQISAGLVVPLVDMSVLEARGMTRADLPSGWSELNHQVIEMAEAGQKGSYFPFWFDEGIGLSVGFIAEVLNRGGYVVDPDLHTVSMAIDSGPAFDTLTEWREMVNSGAVDMRVMDMNFFDAVKSFSSGNHLYSAFTIDALLRAKKSGRKLSILPKVEHDWGVMGSVSYGLVLYEGESDKRRVAKRKLLQLYTRGMKGNEFAVSRELLRTIGYFSPYRDYMESEEAQSILRSRLSYPSDAVEVMRIFESMPFPSGEWRAQWATEFNQFMRAELGAFIRNKETSPKQVITRLNDKIDELRHSYGY